MAFEKILEEFNEQVASHYRLAATKGEAQRKLSVQSDELLDQVPSMVGLLNDHPVYAGLAFYGKFQFADRKLIAQLSGRGAEACEAIDAIRAGKALRIAAPTKPAWDCLLNENPEALWVAIQLNLNVKIPHLAPFEDADDTDNDPEEEDDQDETFNHDSDDSDDDDRHE